MLDFRGDYAFTRKMLDIGAYFSKSPTELAGRMAEVLSVIGRVYATWQYEERMGFLWSGEREGRSCGTASRGWDRCL